MKKNIIEPLPEEVQKLGFEEIGKRVLTVKVPPREKPVKEEPTQNTIDNKQ